MALIVVAEDTSLIRAGLCSLLKQHGHSVLEAVNGNECLDHFASTPPALIVTDIMMPEKGGIETIQAIKEKWPWVKIIAMSGGDPGLLEIAKMHGAHRILRKPFQPRERLDVVADLLTVSEPTSGFLV